MNPRITLPINYLKNVVSLQTYVCMCMYILNRTTRRWTTEVQLKIGICKSIITCPHNGIVLSLKNNNFINIYPNVC